MRKIKFPTISNPKLFLSILATSIPFTIWVISTVSYLYVNYLGSFIFNLSQLTEIFLFLFLPFTGLFTGIMAYREYKTKFKFALIIVNCLLLGIIVLAAALRVY